MIKIETGELRTYYDYSDAISRLEMLYRRQMGMVWIADVTKMLEPDEVVDFAKHIASLKRKMMLGAATAVWPGTGMTIVEMEAALSVYNDVGVRVSDESDRDDWDPKSPAVRMTTFVNGEATKVKEEILWAKECLVLSTGEVLPRV